MSDSSAISKGGFWWRKKIPFQEPSVAAAQSGRSKWDMGRKRDWNEIVARLTAEVCHGDGGASSFWKDNFFWPSWDAIAMWKYIGDLPYSASRDPAGPLRSGPHGHLRSFYHKNIGMMFFTVWLWTSSPKDKTAKRSHSCGWCGRSHLVMTRTSWQFPMKCRFSVQHSGGVQCATQWWLQALPAGGV